MSDTSPIVVLHVDDDHSLLDLTKTFLEGESEQLRIHTATSSEAALSVLRETAIDCIVSDYEMPEMDGLELLDVVREEYPELPFVLFTSAGSEEIASRAISAGVTDYIEKEITSDGCAVLANRIENAVHTYRTENALRESEERYRTVVEGSHDAIYIYQDNRFAFVNERVCEITGYDAEELRGMNVWTLLHPADHERIKEIAASRKRGNHSVSTYEAKFKTKDDDVRYGDFSVRRTSYDGKPATIGTVRDVTDRKRSERRLQALIEHSQDIVTLIDETGIIRYESPSVSRLGYDMDDLLGELAFDYIHPDDRQHVMETFYRALEDPTVTPTITYRFQHADGSWNYLETTGENHLTDPAVEGLVLNSRDVTELRRMKEERNEILARMTDAFLALDDEWRFTYLNRRAEQILRRTAPEIIGENIWELFPETVDSFFYEGFREAMRTQEPTTFEGYYEPLDGWFEANVYPSDNGVSIYLRDVTERKNREETLESLHDSTRELMQAETSADVSELAVTIATDVLELPVTGIWQHENDEFRLAARTEMHREEYGTGVSISDRRATLEAFEADETIIRREQEDGEVREGEEDGEEWEERDGEEEREEEWENETESKKSEAFVPLGSRGVMAFGGDELDDFDVYYAQLLAANTAAALDRAEREDERKANQRELERQNERLEEFANLVSHDLRNPLNVAQGYLDLYRATEESEHLARVDNAHERMAGIVKDVLTLARQGQTVSETKPVYGSEITTNAWASVETGSATLDVSWETTIDADASRLQQVLENLFRNAIEHAGSDVAVTVGELNAVGEGKVGRNTSGAGTARSVSSIDSGAGFYVEDDGPGIPESSRESVFETGYSTAETGTGFGLTIVKQIAEAHGWNVSLRKGETGGTRFEFTGVELAE
ncbi:PAS domain S-box protein [Haladaptatus litoreus]|nr:PAS domain S-box protein [Haladaptatus litoreus]